MNPPRHGVLIPRAAQVRATPKYARCFDALQGSSGSWLRGFAENTPHAGLDMVPDIFLHVIPEESLPGKGEGAGLTLVTSQIMNTSQGIALQRVRHNILEPLDVGERIFENSVQNPILQLEPLPLPQQLQGQVVFMGTFTPRWSQFPINKENHSRNGSILKLVRLQLIC